jgi:diacylglycerol kinase family enzyme
MSQQEQTSTETVLIVNPNSCGGSTGKNWENLYNQIKESFGENPEVAFSQKSGDGTSLTRDFLRKGFKKIVALGGDGTINEVANGFFEVITSVNNRSNDKTAPASPILKLINPEATMGLVPSGSRNVLTKSLDLPDGIIECCQRFVNGKPQKIDVIAAVITTAEAPATAASDHPKEVTTRLFLNAAEIGVGAEIIDRSKKIRDKINSRFISTISGVIATLDEFVNMKGNADNTQEKNDIFYMQAKKVSIKSKERDITVTLDGEPIGILPATVQFYQNALSVKCFECILGRPDRRFYSYLHNNLRTYSSFF